MALKSQLQRANSEELDTAALPRRWASDTKRQLTSGLKFKLIQGGFNEPSMFLAGLGARIDFSALYESRICAIGFGFDFGFCERPFWRRRTKGPGRASRMKPPGPSAAPTPTNPAFTPSPTFRPACTPSPPKPPASRSTRATDNKLDPSATLAVDVNAYGRRGHRNGGGFGLLPRLCRRNLPPNQALVTRQQIDMLELNGRNPVGLAASGARRPRPATPPVSASTSRQGPSNFNGSRNPENLITYDGAPATRTRSNGTSLGAADVDSTSGSPDPHRRLCRRIRPHFRRTDPHPDPGRRPAVPRRRIRLRPQRRVQRQHLDAQPHARRAGLAAEQQRAAVPLQPVRVQRRRSVLHSRQVQQGQATSSSGIGVRSGYGTGSSIPPTWTVPTALMRQGNFSELLTNNPVNILGKVVQLEDPNTKVPIPGNIIPVTLQSPNGLGILKAYPQADIPVGSAGGTSNYYVTALHPQNQRKDTLAVGYEPHRQAAPPVPPQQLRLLRIPASRRHADRNAASSSIAPTRPIR